MCPLLIPKHFGGTVSGIVIAGHGETIGPRIVKGKYISFVNFRNASIAGKGICLTDISSYGIKTILPMGVRNVSYLVLRPVKHWSNKVVKTTIHLRKNCGSCLFYHIYLYQELTSFAN